MLSSMTAVRMLDRSPNVFLVSHISPESSIKALNLTRVPGTIFATASITESGL